MKNKDLFPLEKEVDDIFIITMDVIEECLSEAIEREDFEETKLFFPAN